MGLGKAQCDLLDEGFAWVLWSILRLGCNMLTALLVSMLSYVTFTCRPYVRHMLTKFVQRSHSEQKKY